MASLTAAAMPLAADIGGPTTAEFSLAAEDIVIVVAVLLIYGVFSRWLARSWITTAMAMMLLGALLGTNGLGLFKANLTDSIIEVLATITLAVVLFSDASTVHLGRLRARVDIPARMLTVGLLGTMALGALVAYWLLPWLTWEYALVIGVILAPTDAALGQAVVSDPNVPVDIRQSLNVESGLNDGIAVPFLSIAVSLAVVGSQSEGGPGELILTEVGIAALIGIAIGAVAAQMVRFGVRYGTMSPKWRGIVPAATALGAFLVADLVGGSGFIGAFVAGLTFGPMTRHTDEHLDEYLEESGGLMAAVTFFVFGALALGVASNLLTWRMFLLAVLSLTLVRAVPVLVSLIGTGLNWRSKLMLAWFGPRGLATIVFAIIVIGGNVPGREVSTIVGAAVLTVMFSVVLHGLSAVPLSRAYGKWAATHGE